MAFGLDDTLATAAAGIKLTDTVVRTVEAYRKKNKALDIERLIEAVRLTALEKIDETDRALGQFERMLVEKGVDLDSTLQQAIDATRWWRPDEAFRLKSSRRSFNALADAIYDANDDIAALLRCRDQTGEMGIAVVESARAKHEMQAKLLGAHSVREMIDLLRSTLLQHKAVLMR